MNKERAKARLTEETIEQFLASLQEKGRSQDSVKTYRQTLTALLDFLPEDGQITEETGPAWREWMTDQGLAPRTINARVSVLNSYCQYIGRKDWVQEDFFRENGELQPELSRTEYLRLLQTAKLLGKEKSYLLIKTGRGCASRSCPSSRRRWSGRALCACTTTTTPGRESCGSRRLSERSCWTSSGAVASPADRFSSPPTASP